MSLKETPPGSRFSSDEKAAMRQLALPVPVQTDIAEIEQLARRRKHRRIAHFFFTLATFFFVYHFFAGRASEDENGGHGWNRSATSLIDPGWFDAYDGVTADCVNDISGWTTDGPFAGYFASRDVYQAGLNFELQPSLLNHFITAIDDLRALAPTRSLGTVVIVPAPSGSVNVSVAINVVYSDPSTLDALRVCNVQAGGEAGVVLASLSPRPLDPAFTIGIAILIPEDSGLDFETKLPGFVHEVAPGVDLKSLSIVTDQAVHFHAGNAAGDIKVQTANSPITGFFNVSSGLRLATRNAPIDVDVEAYHTGHHWPSTIRLITANAKLNATLSLKNTTETGRFRVFASTNNSPVNVTVLESPVNGRLHVEAKTRNAPALLELDSAFEGSFAAHTTNAEPALNFKEGVEDPAGEQRERFVETSYVSPGRTGGSVAWGKPLGNHPKSIAAVATTNEPAVLVL